MPSATSLVPNFDTAVHIVFDDFGKHGRAYRETDETNASFESVVDGLLSGQYSSPMRVVAFNTAEGWARDVSEEVAQEMVMRAADRDVQLADGARRFVDRYVDEEGFCGRISNAD